VTEDSTTPAVPEGDPTPDTPDEQPADTGANTQQAQQPTEDWQARYLAAQSWGTQQAQARRQLEDKLLEERQARSRPAADPADPLAADRQALELQRQQLQWDRDWAEIQRTQPPEIIEAFQEAQRAWALDPSPRGAVQGFVQGIQTFAVKVAAAQGQQPRQAPPAAAAPPVTRGVDTSRSEAPDPGLDQKIAGAQKSHDLLAGVRALIGRPEEPAKR
jgi:hypothetical protein